MGGCFRRLIIRVCLQAQRAKDLSRIEEQKEEIRQNLSPAQILAFQKAFNLFDLDGGGSITADELATVIDDMGVQMTSLEVEKMVQDIDLDGNGEVRALHAWKCFRFCQCPCNFGS